MHNNNMFKSINFTYLMRFCLMSGTHSEITNIIQDYLKNYPNQLNYQMGAVNHCGKNNYTALMLAINIVVHIRL